MFDDGIRMTLLLLCKCHPNPSHIGIMCIALFCFAANKANRQRMANDFCFKGESQRHR